MSTFPQITSPPQASAEVLVNRMGETLEHQAVYGLKQSTTTALTWGYYGGRWGGFAITAGTVTLTDGATNYLVVAIATGVLSASTATTNWNDAAAYARVYKITTASGLVSAVEDHRAGPGGVHGGAGGGGGDVGGPGSSTDGDFAQFDGGDGALLKGGISLDTDISLAANSDTRLASQKAVKTYVDAATGGGGASDLLVKNFVLTTTIVPRDVQPAAGVVVAEPFTTDSGQFTKYTEATAATFTVTGHGVVTNSSGAARNDIICVGADLTMPVWASSVTIAARSGSPTTYDNIGVGIAKDANNFVLASYDRIAGALRMQVKIGGSSNFYASVSGSLAVGDSLGFSLIGNSVCLYKKPSGGNWQAITGYAISTGTINFKTASLTGWKTALAVATHDSCVWEFDDLNGGAFGSVGMRDMTFVTEEDGTPYDDGTYLYFTATCADWLGNWHQGVFSLDKSTNAIAQVGNFMVDRGSAKQNDINAHLIRYSAASYRVTITSWGNGFSGALDLYCGTTTNDLLSGSYLLSGLSALTIPGQAAGWACYDPQLVKTGGTWKLAHCLSKNTSFSGSPFFPALSTSADLSTWTTGTLDNGTRVYEGTKYVQVGADLLITAGGYNDVRVYDEDLNFRGTLRATMFGGDLLTQPHAAIAYTGSKYLLVTFTADKPSSGAGSFAWGNVLIHEAV